MLVCISLFSLIEFNLKDPEFVLFMYVSISLEESPDALNFNEYFYANE